MNGTTWIGVPQTLAQVQAGTSYNSIARTFDMQSRRDTIAADLRFSATDNVDLILGVKSYSRSGNQPWGIGFAFNNLVEIPMVVDNRETEIATGVEWASHQGMFRVMYEHSKFSQAVPTLTVDNPLHATDWNSTPGTGYDPNGYTNAHGAALSKMAMAPTNTLDTVNWMGMVKLPGRTTANAVFNMGANRQNQGLIPWTTNPVVANANTYVTFPALASLPRESAAMYVNYITSAMNVTSRPVKYLTLNARYRYNSRNDFTRMFHAEEYVRMDAVPEETGGETEPFAINRNTFDVNASLTPLNYGAIRFGYGYDRYEHGVRAAEGWKDKTFRVSFDTASFNFMTLRAMYENSARELVDLDTAAILGVGHQPALRFFDEAARNRDRFTLMAEFNPMSSVGVNLSVAYGKDDYKGADSTQQFGLLNNDNMAYTIGVSYAPEREGQRRRRLRPGDVHGGPGVAQREPGSGRAVDRPEPELDDDQRREREHVHALPQPQQADREDRHAVGLRLQQLGSGVRALGSADCGSRGDGAGAVRRPAERDQRVDAPDVRSHLRAVEEAGARLLAPPREVRRVRLRDHQHRRPADVAARRRVDGV